MTASRLQTRPESPRYIDIPEPPQQTIPDKRWVKGILPIPRDIFSGKALGKGLDKADKERIALSTKEPERQNTAPISSQESRIEWKQRMASMRRRNLREGLQSLKDRRVRTDGQLVQRGKRRQEAREALVHAPEREDERLTNPSIALPLQNLLRGNLADPDREARLAKMRARVEAKEAARIADREDALHTLYMQARSFITTETQLNQAVDAAFGTPEQPLAFGTTPDDNSMWSRGAPPTVQNMLNSANQTGATSALGSAGGYARLTKQRVKRIAEKLTGGRMDEPTLK